MKNYYKHNHGYINIDDENVYFIKSGNWQEACETKEKKSAKKIKRVNILMSALYISILLIFIIRENYIFLLLAVVLFAQHLYTLLTKTVQVPYKVPLSKIDNMELTEKGFILHFKNEANEPDKQVINGIEDEGLKLISAITGLNIIL